LKPDIINSFKAPPPTRSELKLRSLLRSKKIAFKEGQVIWYTGCDKYTPDLIIGKKLIIEVDGKIHDRDYLKTPDRIRRRALENMGYNVLRVKNEQILNMADDIAERIIERYSIIVESDDRSTKITKLEKPSDYDPMPREIADNLRIWAISFNKELNDEKWSADYFKRSLERFHSKLVSNQCAMERLILLLLGLNLRKREDGSLDFEYSSNLLKRSIEILKYLFGEEGNMAAIHLKNMYNVSVPNFFKNLIFNGGPIINPRIVSIKNDAVLNSHIHNFNKSFSYLGITVEGSDIKSECNATLKKINKNELASYDWIIEWMNKL
jgi:very-short-patch-repair endonuclease